MACDKVKNLDELLISDILKPNKIIKYVKTSRLTLPGENYGSIMYKLDITIQNKDDNTEEVLHTVAKVLPEGEVLRKIFNIQVTYTNEMAFYKVIVPTLLEFQKECGVKDLMDCFATCYAARKNLLENSDTIDDDAVLLLDNLNTSGFVNIDRHKGFDLETTKLVLKDLAQFHGVPIALKVRKPKKFHEKIRPHCQDFNVKSTSGIKDKLLALVINENEECAKILSKIPDFGNRERAPPREPYATIVHDDLWTNNTMQKFENEKPVANKFVDFQIYTYGSPATDLFFFLWSSVPQDLLEKNLDYLVKYYYENLIVILENHSCDITPFSFKAFLEEIRIIAEYEFYHALFFHLIAVKGKKGGFDMQKMPSAEDIYESVNDTAKEKAWYMVKECYNRGWLR